MKPNQPSKNPFVVEERFALMVSLVLMGGFLAWLFLSFGLRGSEATGIEKAFASTSAPETDLKEQHSLAAIDDCLSCTVERPDDLDALLAADELQLEEEVWGAEQAPSNPRGQADASQTAEREPAFAIASGRIVRGEPTLLRADRSEILRVERIEVRNLIRIHGRARHGVHAIALKIGDRQIGPAAVDEYSRQWQQDVYLEGGDPAVSLVEYDADYERIAQHEGLSYQYAFSD